MTYTAEEMPDKDDEHASCDVATSVKSLERMRFAMAVKNKVVLDLPEGLRGGNLVVRCELTLEIFGLGLVDLDGRWRGFAPRRSRFPLRY